MNVERWLIRQEPRWLELEQLLNRAEIEGIRGLSAAEICRLSQLYRLVSADLARAKTRRLGSSIVNYLQGLTLRSYSQIYQSPHSQKGRKVWWFFQRGFPAVVQQTWIYTALALGVFLVAAAIAWGYGWRDRQFLELLVPADILSRVEKEGKLWTGAIVGIEPLASSAIMTNNLSVALATVAGGILGGLGTLYILWNNGLHIGAIAALVAQHNLGYPFWAFVSPHGALELPAIFLAGAAGLLLGQAILFPGRYPRLSALKRNGTLAAQLMFGIVPLLVIAGIIEGFWSPNPLIPNAVKYLSGLGLFAALGVYLAWPIERSPTGERK
ncbi:stage II sporulation protein M [Thermosynechococcus vestitus]|uniref:Tll1058 protein n=1 Tax=Thermosynechococcus vestitus (strain NIES-2133 / IAM M-273 / BP-1) TaxID=197221 RepID=Q8DK12_THEVB|nr:stage II sporulation protein M [Thermosynechococcus vestitus]BAC08611.1 tll1058 [Thermosynechococcus vestitus BP-1]